MQVIAVIADLVDSKAVAQRAVFQRKLGKVLEQTGQEAQELASPYTITLGDEFQAVYRTADTLFPDIFTIMAGIHPVRARFALGVGELTTRINPEQALGMDGPVFHQARAALTGMKEDGGLLRIAGANEDIWRLGNRALNLVSHQVQGWTGNRLQILAGLLRERPVREIEQGMKISRVAVYKNIRAAALDDVAGICQELRAALNRTLRNR
jgi:hypothetical protein